MIDPEEVRALQSRESEDLRQLMAFCAGICAHRDGDGGEKIADALRRIADRVSGMPRRAA